MTKEVPAAQSCEIASPARTARPGVSTPPVRASVSVATSASSAPANAATGSRRPIPTTSTATAPSEAPDDRPSRYGSARGLRVRLCITAPPSARPAPTAAAVSTRGRRRSHTIASVRRGTLAVDSPRCRPIARSTSAAAMSAGPMVTATTTVAISTTTRTGRTSRSGGRSGRRSISARGTSACGGQCGQLLAEAHDGVGVAHPCLRRRERHGEVAVLTDRRELAGRGVLLEQLDLLRGGVPRRVDEHDDVRVGGHDLLPADGRPGVVDALEDVADPDGVHDHLRCADPRADVRGVRAGAVPQRGRRPGGYLDRRELSLLTGDERLGAVRDAEDPGDLTDLAEDVVERERIGLVRGLLARGGRHVRVDPECGEPRAVARAVS